MDRRAVDAVDVEGAAATRSFVRMIGLIFVGLTLSGFNLGALYALKCRLATRVFQNFSHKGATVARYSYSEFAEG